jgi:hypothetical protein
MQEQTGISYMPYVTGFKIEAIDPNAHMTIGISVRVLNGGTKEVDDDWIMGQPYVDKFNKAEQPTGKGGEA